MLILSRRVGDAILVEGGFRREAARFLIGIDQFTRLDLGVLDVRLIERIDEMLGRPQVERLANELERRL